MRTLTEQAGGELGQPSLSKHERGVGVLSLATRSWRFLSASSLRLYFLCMASIEWRASGILWDLPSFSPDGHCPSGSVFEAEAAGRGQCLQHLPLLSRQRRLSVGAPRFLCTSNSPKRVYETDFSFDFRTHAFPRMTRVQLCPEHISQKSSLSSSIKK